MNDHPDYISSIREDKICPLCYKEMENSEGIWMLFCKNGQIMHYGLSYTFEGYETENCWVIVDFVENETEIRTRDGNDVITIFPRSYLSNEREKLNILLCYI